MENSGYSGYSGNGGQRPAGCNPDIYSIHLLFLADNRFSEYNLFTPAGAISLREENA